MPIKRAGRPASNGNHLRAGRRAAGNRRRLRFASCYYVAVDETPASPGSIRVGHSRRFCTSSRSATETGPSLNFSASRFAVATASCSARLIPTPPAGDIAWALSPMQSSPSRHHLPQTIDLHGKQFDFFPVIQLRDAILRNGANPTISSCKWESPLFFDRFEAAFRDHEPAWK